MRFSPPDPKNYSEEQSKIANDIASGPRGGVRGPLAMWLHRPKLANAAQNLGAYCRYNSSLPARLSELAILMTATHWQADYEWAAHEPQARKAGLSEEVISALKAGERPLFELADEDSVYQVAIEILNNRKISDATYSIASNILGQDGLVDLIGILGYYSLISMTITAFDIEARGQVIFKPYEDQ